VGHPQRERKEAWIVDYTDGQGDRHIETFERKKDADVRHAAVTVEVERGIHTAKGRSITLAAAAEDWDQVRVAGEARAGDDCWLPAARR
jgi:integrase